jgi:succinoglycan biosynthesis transport protein ExoP
MNRKFIFGPCAIVVGLVLCGVGLWILLSPVGYRATVKIEIEADTLSDIPEMNSGGNSYDPYFFETELKAIGSDIVLSNVVETLNLNTQWGKRYGRTLETSETVSLLRQRIDLRLARNSMIVEIHVTDEDPKEAAQIANAIAEAYKDYRIAQHKQEIAEGIKMLEKVYAKEEAKILLMQSNLDLLRRQFFINHNPYPYNSGPSLTLDEQPRLKEVYIEDEADYKKMKSLFTQLQSLQATNPAMLRVVLPAMCNDDVLSNLLGELGDNTLKLAAETNNVGGTNSDYTAIQASIAHLNEQVDARVNGIMITLKDKVDGAKTKLDVISRILNELEVEGQPYWKAKDELDQEKEVLELLKAKIEAEKADLAIPKDLPVKVIDPAIPPTAPSGPNRKWGAVLLVCGLSIASFGFYSLRKADIRE